MFLREKHRSSHYFAEGDEKILLSAASIDLGGICITPLEKDFEQMTKEKLTEILSEVALNKNSFHLIKQKVGMLLKPLDSHCESPDSVRRRSNLSFTFQARDYFASLVMTIIPQNYLFELIKSEINFRFFDSELEITILIIAVRGTERSIPTIPQM